MEHNYLKQRFIGDLNFALILYYFKIVKKYNYGYPKREIFQM